MAKQKNTRVRFLGGYASSRDLLGVLSYPVALDEYEVEHTRFIMTNFKRWVQSPFECDIVSVTFGDGPHGKCWWLLGKRGQVFSFNSLGTTQEVIADAGTGSGKLGYVNCIKQIGGKLYACGYRRQVYERLDSGWIHHDAGILLGEDATGFSLNDLEGSGAGVLCAVGNDGEIATDAGSGWAMHDSPTNEHLYAICLDGSGLFCACGANGTVVRGNASGFEVMCSGETLTDPLWDIEWFNGDLVISASAGIFVVRDGTLLPFDNPAPPKHVGYKLTCSGGRLWSIGTYQIFCLEDKIWYEWICPDNGP